MPFDRTGLAEAADRNLAAHFAWVHRHLPGMRVADWPDVSLTDSGLGSDTFNAACRARFEPAEVDSRLAAVFDWFGEARHCFSWWTGPADRPPDLGRILEREYRLEPAEAELAMSLGLDRLRPGGWPAELAIERATDSAGLADFAAVVAANWSPPDPLVTRFYRDGGVALLRADSPLRLYLGRVEGLPVATAELTVAGGVAGLYNISTLEAWRGRGYGTAMTICPLLDARAAGLDTAVLQAAPGAVGIYRRLGFEVCGEVIEYRPGAR